MQYTSSSAYTHEEQSVLHIRAVRKATPSAMAQWAQTQHTTVWIKITTQFLVLALS